MREYDTAERDEGNDDVGGYLKRDKEMEKN